MSDSRIRPDNLRMTIMDDESVQRLIELAMREDMGAGDLSAGLLAGKDAPADFQLLAKQTGVFCGCSIAQAVLKAYDESIEVHWTDAGCDGRLIETTPITLAAIQGPLGAILSAERVLLNFLQRLSGIAALTRRYVEAVAGTKCRVYDTRKTTPGWRVLEKYAVRCGGGFNHRMGLHDAVLIKDNHLTGVETHRLAGVMFDLLNRLSESAVKPNFVEVEADSLAQVEALLKVVGIDGILLDNFPLDQMRQAVEMRDGLGLQGKVWLEASGGITLETVRAAAETGVDRLSVGAMTHSAVALEDRKSVV